MSPIASLLGLTILTPKLDAMARFYEDAFGLVPAKLGAGEVALRGRLGTGPQLTLRASERRGLAGISFAMRSREEADASARDLASTSVTLLRGPAEGIDGYGFAVADPDGTEVEFHVAAAPAGESGPDNDRPLYLSHVVLNSPDTTRLTDFYTRVLGLTISDTYEKGLFAFLRCDQPQHHCLGIAPGERPALNHFAMDCGDIDALMRSVARMNQLGYPALWGPGRHGPGGNIFCYYEDPDGFVPEFTCDVLQVDPASWTPKEWRRTPTNANIWGTGTPSPRAVELMTGSPPR